MPVLFSFAKTKLHEALYEQDFAGAYWSHRVNYGFPIAVLLTYANAKGN